MMWKLSEHETQDPCRRNYEPASERTGDDICIGVKQTQFELYIVLVDIRRVSARLFSGFGPSGKSARTQH